MATSRPPQAGFSLGASTAELEFLSDGSAGVSTSSGGLWHDAWRRYLGNRAAVVASAIFLLVALFAIAVPFVSPYDPIAIDFDEADMPPSREHPFGTDRFGRDMLTRTALGTRISLGIAFTATIAMLVVGVAYGSIAGFSGGRLDSMMMRFLDALYGLPALPFAILTVALIGTNFWSLVIALSIVSWFTMARIVRGQVMTLKQNDYVRAAKSFGARWHRVVWRHLLPNTLGILIIATFLALPEVILAEAVLSFIGLGISPPDPSLGLMAREGHPGFRVHPWQIVIPSVTIAVIVLCAYFIADGLRDALDPKAKEA